MWFSGTLELRATKQSAHRGHVCSVAFSPDGKTIISSGSSDKANKVWDAGEPFHHLPYPIFSPLIPLPCPSQVLWSSRRVRRAPTVITSTRSPSLRTARPSFPDRATRRSKCGTQVRNSSIRASHALLTLPMNPGSDHERGGLHCRRLDGHERSVLARWVEDRLGAL